MTNKSVMTFISVNKISVCLSATAIILIQHVFFDLCGKFFHTGRVILSPYSLE